MTRFDIEERRLRRLEKRIRHLEALLKLNAIFGGPARKRTENRVRELWIREAGRMWELLHPDGEPEDMARAGCGKDVNKRATERKDGKKDGSERTGGHDQPG